MGAAAFVKPVCCSKNKDYLNSEMLFKHYNIYLEQNHSNW